MEKACKVLGWVIEVLGVIGSFSMAKTFGVAITYESLFSEAAERNWGLTVGIFLGGVLATSALAFILLGISEALERAYDTEKRVYDLQRQVEKMAEHGESTGDTWKCQACGKQNPGYVGTCSCGQGRE